MSSNGEILAQAVARNAAMVLSLPSAGMLRHHKSRFLGEDDGALWVQGVPQEQALVGQLIAEQQPVGVALRGGDLKIVFTTAVVRHDPCYRLRAGTTTDALLLKAPESVKVVQRRNNYRVQIAHDQRLAARVWRLPEHAKLEDEPASHQELQVKLRDISTGGAGLLMNPDQTPLVVYDERLRISLASTDVSLMAEDLLIEGRVRFLAEQTTGAAWRMGVEFTSLEQDLSGRTTLAALTRLVGQLQREELRRKPGIGGKRS